jgi:hypothetical protein
MNGPSGLEKPTGVWKMCDPDPFIFINMKAGPETFSEGI